MAAKSNITRVLTGLGMYLLVATGCTTDKDIKAQITGLAKTDVNFADVNYTVENKVVTLTGYCPSKKSKDEVEATMKSIRVVKGINNQIQIAPVVLDNAFPLKQAVDSVLAQYPTVQANVTTTQVTLMGKVKKPEADKLLPAITKLNIGQVINQLTVN
jgi:hyperosmotically inducible protein